MNPESRRSFLKTASAAAAGTALLSGLSNRAYAAGEETINVGLVGCGGRGTGAAGQALKTKGNVRLMAVADAFPEPIERALYGITRDVAKKTAEGDAIVDVPPERQYVGLDAYDKLLADPDIDVVVLATPPGFRPMQFEAAVKAGKHIFFEKPVATDAPGVQRVLAAAQEAKKKNLKVGVGLQRHHQPCYQDLVGKIHEGAIGDIISLRVYWNGGGVWEPKRTREQVKTEMEYQVWNWYYYNWLSGDHICEQHIHNLDVGCWVKGKDGAPEYPIKANGMGGRQVRTDKRYGEIFDHHYVEFTFADGSFMASQCRHIKNCWSPVDEHVHATKGRADLDATPRNCKLYDAQGNVTYQFEGKTETPYQIEHDDLFNAIRNDISYNEAEYGARSTMVAILGRMCTYSGKEITWDDAINSKKSIMPEKFAWDAEPPTHPDADGNYPIPMPGSTKVL
ncbi:MAG: Gfo/Idh/MocA family protein [Planctomycetaceae bacterium]